MSLILEALKKSEAERRLGQAPGLLSQAPPSRRRHGLWPLLAVLVLAVGLSTGITWWLLRPTPAAPPAGDVAADAANGAVDGDAATTAARSAGTAPQPPRAATASVAPVADAEPPPAPATTAPRPAVERPAVERESAAMPASGALPLPPEPVGATPRSGGANVAAAVPAPLTVDVAAPDTAPAALAASDAVVAADAHTAGAEPALPGVHALPTEVQSALPPLKVSMHVFNDDPAQRFVLIDGRRYAEGMKVGDGLLIEAIRRDGVVLVFRGHRFLLPRPG